MVEPFEPELTPADEERVRAYMQSLAASRSVVEPQLADARSLWLKAQLLRRWDAEAQAQRPLDVMERVQFIAGAVAAAILFAWSVPALRSLAQ
jgi:hypothetical protein